MIILEHLTKREIEVLELVGKKKMNREIALVLGIGEGTVIKYLVNCHRKLHVKKRMEAYQKYKENKEYYNEYIARHV